MEKMFNFPLLSFHRYYYSESFQKNVIYLQLDVATSCRWRRCPCCLRQMEALILFLLLCFAVLQFVKNPCFFFPNGVPVMLLWHVNDPGWDHTCNLSCFRETHIRKMVFIKAVLTSGSKLLTTSAANIYHQHFSDMWVCCLRWNLVRLSRAQ